MKIVILGLSITSSWGNGHAITYRGLVRELSARGHDVLFLERDRYWYANNRDLPQPPWGRTQVYEDFAQLTARFSSEMRDADLVIVGSYVPDGVAVGNWVTQTARGVTAFYDIDTPITLAKLEHGDFEYLSPTLISRYQLYLSFTGGPILKRLEKQYGSPCARALYCSFDPALYFPEPREWKWQLGYMGTYSVDRQHMVEQLLFVPARQIPDAQFIIAGAQYPPDLKWPANVEYVMHLNPREHRAFYSSQRFTLNVTRAEMIAAGYAPSTRLFEAAACATPVISDYWHGIETFFSPGVEILIARRTKDVLAYLREVSDTERRAIGERARARVLAEHTPAHRAAQLERYVEEVVGSPAHTMKSATQLPGSASHAAAGLESATARPRQK